MVKTIERSAPRSKPPVKEGRLVRGNDTHITFLVIDAPVGGKVMAVALESNALVKAGEVMDVAQGTGFEVLPVGARILLEQD